ncbi:ABC transporter permease [Thalassobacillus pellis]|uniref:ABC transporter permease n=1 Tax=Thalassobacillus pellis TaxID=748008 RepID=UPI001961A2D3|nr:ABC transporter permease [Thalassobacillus pellis]MBM7553434.1 putative ABC transport system permease protein [Thalassobacillus pellis]
MPLWKKLFRTIAEKKAQYFSAWLLVVISSALFYAFTAAGANLVDNLETFYQENNVEDARFFVQHPLKSPQQLEDRFHVQLEKQMSLDVSMDENTDLRLISNSEKINQYSVIEGEKLQTKDEILLDQGFAKAHALAVGEEMELKGKTFTVAGTMATPAYIYPLKSTSGFLKNPDAFGVAIVQEDILKKWENAHDYYTVRFQEDNRGAFKEAVTEQNQILNWVDKEDNNRITFIKGDITGIKKMGETLPIGILLITLVIISILLWRLMKKEYVQIGTLYALGYKKAEIIRHYLSYAAILAVTGSLAGTVIGWLLMHPLMASFAHFYNLPVLDTNPYFPYLIVSFLLPMVFFLPLTYLLVRRVLKIPPVTLMKGGTLKTKVNRIERLFKLRKLDFKKKFITRDILRNLPRSGFLAIGVLFASLLLLMGFITKDSMTYLVDENFENVYHYQYEYTFNQLQTGEPEHGQAAASAPFVVQDDEDQSLTITGLKPGNTAIQLESMTGEELDFDSVIMNKSLAEKLEISPGDSLEVTNQLSGETFSVTVDHIANSYLGDMIYMPLKKFNQLNGYPENSYTTVYSDQKLDIPQEKLAAKSEISDMVSGFEKMIEPLNYFIVAIALAAAVIAIIIMYILISLMIEENSYKISLMKVLGYHNREIHKLVIGYNRWFVILGFLLGIPVTFVSTSALLNSVTAEMNITIPVKIDWINILISFFVILGAYYVTVLLNKRQLKKISMQEAINRSTE